MAKFYIDDKDVYYLSLYITGEHDATTWILSKDVGFTKIIDKVEKSKECMLSWTTTMPKIPEDKETEDEEYYMELDELYLKVAIHSGESTSPYITIGPLQQRAGEILITKGDEIVKKTTATELGWYDEEV